MSGEEQIWVKNLGNNLIKSIEIKIGDVILDKIDNIYNEHKIFNYCDVIGNKVISQKEQTLHVPLGFHFDNNNVIFQNPDDIFIDL